MSPFIRALIVVTLAFAASGCAKMRKGGGMPLAGMDGDYIGGLAAQGEVSAAAAPSLMPDAVAPERKLIWTGNLTVEVTAVSNAVAAAQVIIKTAGGYIADSQVTDDDATLGLRVPPARLPDTMAQLGQIGTVLVHRVASQDVTTQFVDTEARLRATKQLRDRLGELVKSATNVTEVLEIERELARVQADIESMESLLRTLGRQSEMAAVTCRFNRRTEPAQEVKRIYGPLGLILKGAGWIIQKLFIIR